MDLKQCIRNLSAAINRIDQPRLLFQRLVEELTQVLLVDHCRLWRLDAEQFCLLAAAEAACVPLVAVGSRIAPKLDGQGEASSTLSLQGWSEGYQHLRQNQVLQVRSSKSSGRRGRVLPPELACEGFVGVPIFAGEQLVGLLELCQSCGSLQCSPTQIASLQQLAELVGIAFTQAGLVRRSLAEAGLRQSESRYRAIVEDQSELIGLYAPSRELTFVNGAFCRFFGKRPEELLGRSCLWLVVEADRERLIRHFTSLSRDHPVATIEEQVWAKNGEIRWLQWTDRAIFNEQGQLVEFQSVGRDITERKWAEADLRRSEERFRISIESLLDCFGIYAAIRDSSGQLTDFRVEYVNAAACTNNGLTKEQQLGKGLLELFPIHQEIGLFDDYRRVVETGQALAKEVVIHQHDPVGRQYLARAFELSATPLGDGLAVAWRDITERKRTEADLHLLRSAVEQSQDAFMITEGEPIAQSGARIVFVNSALSDMTGYQPKEVLDRLPSLFRGPKTDQSQLEKIRTALQARQPLTVELLNYRKDGSEFWAELSLVPIDGGKDHRVHWLSVQRDISERKRLEALERANLKLQQANTNLSRLEKLKSELVATVSHEIRMPLTNVRTAIFVLGTLNLPLEADGRKALSLADRESQRLTQMVNTLLDFSKLDSGTYRWREDPVDLKTVLAQADQATVAWFANRSIQLHCDLPEPSVWVVGDCDRLVQLVINLLDNAAKFSAPASQVWLALTQDAHYARVSVRDQGPGIAAAQQAEIFNLFSQIQGATGIRPPGIGLGLYLCRQIAQHHGGVLTVRSQLKRGSTFMLSLPLLAERA